MSSLASSCDEKDPARSNPPAFAGTNPQGSSQVLRGRFLALARRRRTGEDLGRGCPRDRRRPDSEYRAGVSDAALWTYWANGWTQQRAERVTSRQVGGIRRRDVERLQRIRRPARRRGGQTVSTLPSRALCVGGSPKSIAHSRSRRFLRPCEIRAGSHMRISFEAPNVRDRQNRVSTECLT
jgi:hypothetical protein